MFAFAVTYGIGKLITVTFGFRVTREDELAGIDFTQHAETRTPRVCTGISTSGRVCSSRSARPVHGEGALVILEHHGDMAHGAVDLHLTGETVAFGGSRILAPRCTALR